MLYDMILSAGPCVLPLIKDGGIVEPQGLGPATTVSHGSILRYECGEGFQAVTSTTTCCHNGTWITSPVCEPGL